jgi:dihydropteroate synthase
MARLEQRTKSCPAATRAGRLQKAQQFFDAADMLEALVDDVSELIEASITLCIHAGIAAADVICCARLGKHALGENHAEAVEMLRSVDAAASKRLVTLLGMKTKSSYSAVASSPAERKRAMRAAEQLLAAAHELR